MPNLQWRMGARLSSIPVKWEIKTVQAHHGYRLDQGMGSIERGRQLAEIARWNRNWVCRCVLVQALAVAEALDIKKNPEVTSGFYLWS